MAYKIKWEGNTQRFCGQKKGKLIYVEVIKAKNLNKVIIDCVGKPIPEKSVRQFILLIFIGENQIVFDDIIPYGGTRHDRLLKDMNTWFEIDVPDNSFKQTELEI